MTPPRIAVLGNPTEGVRAISTKLGLRLLPVEAPPLHLADDPDPPWLLAGPGTDFAAFRSLREVYPRLLGLDSGDPSPFTALGVLAAIRACVPDLSAATVAVQGVGRVGAELCRLLVEAGAAVVAADPRGVRAASTEVVPADAVFDVPCDVFSPNARDVPLDAAAIARLRCRFVAGSANGQLAEGAEELLRARGIRWVPEWIAGAGWLLNQVAETDPGGYDEVRARERVRAIEGFAREAIGAC